MTISMESLLPVGGEGVQAVVVVRSIVPEFDGMVKRDQVEVAPYCSNSSCLSTR